MHHHPNLHHHLSQLDLHHQPDNLMRTVSGNSGQEAMVHSKVDEDIPALTDDEVMSCSELDLHHQDNVMTSLRNLSDNLVSGPEATVGQPQEDEDISTPVHVDDEVMSSSDLKQFITDIYEDKMCDLDDVNVEFESSSMRDDDVEEGENVESQIDVVQPMDQDSSDPPQENYPKDSSVAETDPGSLAEKEIANPRFIIQTSCVSNFQEKVAERMEKNKQVHPKIYKIQLGKISFNIYFYLIIYWFYLKEVEFQRKISRLITLNCHLSKTTTTKREKMRS